MHDYLKIAGVLAVLAGAAALVSSFAAADIVSAVTLRYQIGMPLIVTGTGLLISGVIIDHLAAIRRSQERQTEIFERLSGKRTD